MFQFAGRAGEELFRDDELRLADRVAIVDEHVAADHLELLALVVLRAEGFEPGGERLCIRGGFSDGDDKVGRVVLRFLREGVDVDDGAPFVGVAHHDLGNEAEGLLDSGFECGFESCWRCLLGLEHQIAAGEEGTRVCEAESLGHVAELLHRDLAAADIHRAEEGNTAGHPTRLRISTRWKSRVVSPVVSLKGKGSAAPVR